MLLDSKEFILFFLPVVITLFYLIGFFKKSICNKLFLILSSICFYFSVASIETFFILIGTIFFNYFGCNYILHAKNDKFRKFTLFLIVFENASLFFLFQYINFFKNNLSFILSTTFLAKYLVVPIGISFITLQFIICAIDVYNKEFEKFSIIDFFLFALFFPKILMGPIPKYKNISNDFNKSDFYKFNNDNFARGIVSFSIGCAKQIMISPALYDFTSKVFDGYGSGGFIYILALFTNVFAIYFDLSGYADMAIGCGYMFNIKIPDNFNSPYKAKNIREYWQKWHMSVTVFFTDYIFKYLHNKSKGIISFCFASIIVFLVSGIWHGAGTKYLFWGIINGILISISALISYKTKKKFLFDKNIINKTITFSIITLLAGLFSFDNISSYASYILKAFDFSALATLSISENLNNLFIFLKSEWLLILNLIIAAYISFFTANTRDIIKSDNIKLKYIVFSGFLLTLSIFNMSTQSQYIYMNL